MATDTCCPRFLKSKWRRAGKLLTGQVGVIEPGPDLDHLLRCPAVYQHQTLIGTRVPPVLLLNVKRLEAFVFLRPQPQLPQTHPCVNVVDGVERYVLRGSVQPSGQVPGVQIPPSARVWRVLANEQTLWDEILHLFIPVRPRVGDHIPYKQVPCPGPREALEEGQDPQRIDKDVIVPFKDELSSRAACGHPVQEEHLLDGQVEERVPVVPLGVELKLLLYNKKILHIDLSISFISFHCLSHFICQHTKSLSIPVSHQYCNIGQDIQLKSEVHIHLGWSH